LASLKGDQQGQDILLTPLQLYVIFLKQCIPNVTDGCGFLDQLPDPSAHGAQAIVNAGLEMEDHGLALQVSGKLSTNGRYDRIHREDLLLWHTVLQAITQ